MPIFISFGSKVNNIGTIDNSLALMGFNKIMKGNSEWLWTFLTD